MRPIAHASPTVSKETYYSVKRDLECHAPYSSCFTHYIPAISLGTHVFTRDLISNTCVHPLPRLSWLNDAGRDSQTKPPVWVIPPLSRHSTKSSRRRVLVAGCRRHWPRGGAEGGGRGVLVVAEERRLAEQKTEERREKREEPGPRPHWSKHISNTLSTH
jgi:hypothetical protein